MLFHNGAYRCHPLWVPGGGDRSIDLGPPTDTVVVVFYGTGIRGFSNIKNVKATIGATSALVLFAGPQSTFVGLDQVNIQLPRTLIGSGQLNVVLTVDGQASNAVTINIQ